jgi:hypothetical protein
MPELRDLSVLKLRRYFGRPGKWARMAYGFLDSGHDLAEHGFNTEGVLLAEGPVVGLVRHSGGRNWTRSKEREKEWRASECNDLSGQYLN